MAVIPYNPIKFLKIRKVKSPSKANDLDAGIDFYVPEFDLNFIKELKKNNPSLFPAPLNYTGLTFNTATLTMTSGNASNLTQQVSYDLTDDNDSVFKHDDERGLYFLLPPHSRVRIPSGIRVRMSESGRALIAANKSGVSSDHGLIFAAQVVDYTYTGEVNLGVINTGTKVVRIYEGMKILQFLETPIFDSPIEVWEEKENDMELKFYEGFKTTRGASGFGSTDKK